MGVIGAGYKVLGEGRGRERETSRHRLVSQLRTEVWKYGLCEMMHARHRWLRGKEAACQCRSHEFNPWSWKIPSRGKWQPSPVFLPEEPHGQRSLVAYSP